MIDIAFFLIFAAALFVIGMYGLLTSKKGLVTLMCIELMLNAANINFITFASFSGGTAGQVFVIDFGSFTDLSLLQFQLLSLPCKILSDLFVVKYHFITSLLRVYGISDDVNNTKVVI